MGDWWAGGGGWIAIFKQCKSKRCCRLFYVVFSVMKNENKKRCLAIKFNERRDEKGQLKAEKILDRLFSRPTIAPIVKAIQHIFVLFSILDT
jgi:hypothetical protein